MPTLDRATSLARLQERGTTFDVLVVGGGATGLGVALDAATRGLSVALVERGDFAQGTSSRSTKLIHGGVRYLKQGRLGLVREGLEERGRLVRNAPHLVHPLGFVLPVRNAAEAAWYRTGLGLYDLLSGRHSLGPSCLLGRDALASALPGLLTGRASGGIRYLDARFDDARLALDIARAAAGAGAALANHCEVVAFSRDGSGRISGASIVDRESGRESSIHARCIVNATGVFADGVRRLANPAAPRLLAPSRGVHLVLPRSHFPGPDALLVPRTHDGRVLFALPWAGRVLLGTTDTPAQGPEDEPAASPDDIDFLLRHAADWLARPPARQDILGVFAGLRPLVDAGSGATGTAAISREHLILHAPPGLLTVTGGKWTTYRRMAEQVVDRAIAAAGLQHRPCLTHNLSLVPPGSPPPPADPADLAAVPTAADVHHFATEEMARTVEDVLSRRRRVLLADARAAIAAAPAVAETLARSLGRPPGWAATEIARFTALARRYLP